MEEVKEELEKENEELENVEVNEEALKKLKKNKIIRAAIGGLLAIGGIFLAISLGHKKPQFEEVHESTSIEYEMPNYQSSNDDSKDDKQEEISNENDDETKLKNLGDFRLDVDLSQCQTPEEGMEAIEQTYNVTIKSMYGSMINFLEEYMSDDMILKSEDKIFGANTVTVENAINGLICQGDKYASGQISTFDLNDSSYHFDDPYVSAIFDGGFGDVEVKKMPSDFEELVNYAKIINAYENSGLANKDILKAAYRGLYAKTIQVIINDAQGKYDASEFEFKLPELTNQEDYNNDNTNDNTNDGYINPYGEGDIILGSAENVHQLIRA